MYKKYILFTLILCISIVFMGCDKTNNNVENIEFTFSEDEFNELLIEMGEVVRNDIKNMEDSYGDNVSSKKMAKDPLIQKYRFYNDSDLTDIQRKKLHVTLKLNLVKIRYILTPHDKETKDELFEASLEYIKLIDENYSLLDLLYSK